MSSYASFAAWQMASGEDADSLNANPFFVDLRTTPSDFDLDPSSPAIGAGGTGLTCSIGWCDPKGSSPKSIYGRTDLLGNPRMTHGSINIGAYQRAGISNTLKVDLTAEAYRLGRHQSTTLRVKVFAIPGGAGVPSGKVDFILGSKLLGRQTLLPTSATTSAASMPVSASQLAPGVNTLTALYSGNSIAPCCSPSEPPGGGIPAPVYPSATSRPIAVTVSR